MCVCVCVCVCVLSLVCSRADVDAARVTARLKLAGQRDVVSEQTVAWHLHTDDSSQH